MCAHGCESYIKETIFWKIAVQAIRVKRQESEDEEELERQLCEDKGAGEWFRLETGDDKCRDVIQCTSSVGLVVFFLFTLHVVLVKTKCY